jgi:hypothetical protein
MCLRIVLLVAQRRVHGRVYWCVREKDRESEQSEKERQSERALPASVTCIVASLPQEVFTTCH